MATTNGLTGKDIKLFNDLLIKANGKQIMKLRDKLNEELIKRIERS